MQAELEGGEEDSWEATQAELVGSEETEIQGSDMAEAGDSLDPEALQAELGGGEEDSLGAMQGMQAELAKPHAEAAGLRKKKKQCERCGLKRAKIGLPAEGKVRWCSGCADKAHAGVEDFQNKKGDEEAVIQGSNKEEAGDSVDPEALPAELGGGVSVAADARSEATVDEKTEIIEREIARQAAEQEAAAAETAAVAAANAATEEAAAEEASKTVQVRKKAHARKEAAHLQARQEAHARKEVARLQARAAVAAAKGFAGQPPRTSTGVEDEDEEDHEEKAEEEDEDEEAGTVILLMTSTPKSQSQELQQRRMKVAIEGKGIVVEEVDGSNPASKVRRGELFKISGKVAVYPQCFILQAGATKPSFVADWDDFEGLLECESLDAETLAANPDIPTFSKAFASLKRERE